MLLILLLLLLLLLSLFLKDDSIDGDRISWISFLLLSRLWASRAAKNWLGEFRTNEKLLAEGDNGSRVPNGDDSHCMGEWNPNPSSLDMDVDLDFLRGGLIGLKSM